MTRHTPTSLTQDELAPKVDYLQRILDYAFGAQGDRVILECHVGKPYVEQYNKEAEIISYCMETQQDGTDQQQTNRHSIRLR